MVDQKDRSEREKYLEEFKQRYQTGLSEMIDSLEMLGPDPLPPNPASLDMEDDRDFEELETDELAIIKNVLYDKLGIDSQNPEIVRSYLGAQSPEAKVTGPIPTKVIKTNINDIFLQELTFSDSQERWVIGANIDI